MNNFYIVINEPSYICKYDISNIVSLFKKYKNAHIISSFNSMSQIETLINNLNLKNRYNLYLVLFSPYKTRYLDFDTLLKLNINILFIPLICLKDMFNKIPEIFLNSDEYIKYKLQEELIVFKSNKILTLYDSIYSQYMKNYGNIIDKRKIQHLSLNLYNVSNDVLPKIDNILFFGRLTTIDSNIEYIIRDMNSNEKLYRYYRPLVVDHNARLEKIFLPFYDRNLCIYSRTDEKFNEILKSVKYVVFPWGYSITGHELFNMMALGKICVCNSNSETYTSIITNNINGFLFNIKENSLINFIHTIIKNNTADRMMELSEEAKKTVRNIKNTEYDFVYTLGLF